MGTYTTNKNLFMPTVGEQGWGDLVNGNFETIDTFLKPISLLGSTYTFTGNHVGNQSGGSISATNISNSGTLTQTGTSTFTGKITANGGIGTKALTATSISNSGTLTQTGTSTFAGKITANGGVNDYEERITTLEAGEFESANIDNLIADEATFNKIIVPPITKESSFCIYSKTFTPLTGNYGGAIGASAGTITMFDKYLSRTIVTSDFFKVKGVEDDNIEDVTININASTYIVGYVVHDGTTLLQARDKNITQTFTLDISKPFIAKYYGTFSGVASSSLSISITAGTVKYYL